MILSESICLVEMCARFHAHCAARLADLEHTQFDQKLNTDNLTKCLQTLKHMYADVGPEQKPREAEFRGICCSCLTWVTQIFGGRLVYFKIGL